MSALSLLQPRFGFTLLYHRQVALQLPFGDRNLGEDYDWCVALIDALLSFIFLKILSEFLNRFERLFFSANLNNIPQFSSCFPAASSFSMKFPGEVWPAKPSLDATRQCWCVLLGSSLHLMIPEARWIWSLPTCAAARLYIHMHYTIIYIYILYIHNYTYISYI